ncbi:unnamed protein product [Adineta steineri]|uniref:Non-specific protein-tyrosine kinase n=1 Tax=Adineta steineri TaxID=433720 RepID=A0A814MII2_9BILA|nr:unnamed protein product [Adineta steineri]CAF1078429.1 unnamed protein product [Adineta steineri]CAF1436653.1 unnamed protein product [Adineta steineri]CAF1626184.1 unnamed protein product [Adineta steineri]
MTLQLIPNSDLIFQGPFNVVSVTTLKLFNSGNERLAYRIKTTAPKRYCVKPNIGFLDAHTTANIQFMLEPQKPNQPDDRFRHKFMAQWATVPNDHTDDTDSFWKQDSKNIIIQDLKFKCAFVDEQQAAIVSNNSHEHRQLDARNMDTSITTSSLVCPITFQLFHEPVVAEDGHTYEQSAIIEWVQKNHTSPITRQPLSIGKLRPNYTIKSMVQEFETKIRSTNYRFKLNSDVKKGRKTLFQSTGKVIFEASWLTKIDGPPIVLLKISGVKAQNEAVFYTELSRHPHILRTYGIIDEISVSPNSVMLVQEYAPEGSLYEVLEDGESPPKESVLGEISIQLADAMSYLAHNNIIHGDLACRNVLVFRFDRLIPQNNLVKLTDFGLNHASSTYLAMPETSSILNVIPLRYAAPEILSNGNSKDSYTEKSDMYSMGVLMWEAYSKGDIPWLNIEKDDEVCRLVIAGKQLERPTSCSVEHWSIISECMSHQPQNRPTFKILKQQLIELQCRKSFEKMAHINLLSQTVKKLSSKIPLMIKTLLRRTDGSLYEGEMVNGNIHGKGILINEDGARYEGEFRDGEPVGQGVMNDKNGTHFNIEWKNGKMYGRGVSVLPDGARLEIGINENEPDGQAVMTTLDGMRFEFRFSNGVPTGSFIISTAGGARLEAKIDGNDISECILNFPNGDRYEGQVNKEDFSGLGIFTTCNGDRYEGQFYCSKAHGRGTAVWKNGNKYVGEFSKGKLEGKGIFTFPNGVTVEGQFKENTLTGRHLMSRAGCESHEVVATHDALGGYVTFRFPASEPLESLFEFNRYSKEFDCYLS